MMDQDIKNLSSEELEEEIDKAYRGANNTADDPWLDGENAWWCERVRILTAEKNRRSTKEKERS